MLRVFFLLIGLLSLHLPASSQANTHIDFQTHHRLADLNFTQQDFPLWVSNYQKAVEDSALRIINAPSNTIVEIILHHGKETTVNTYFTSKDESANRKFQEAVLSMEYPSPAVTDYVISFMISIHGGKKQAQYSPKYIPYREKKMAEYVSAKLPQKDSLLQDWIDKEVFPAVNNLIFHETFTSTIKDFTYHLNRTAKNKRSDFFRSEIYWLAQLSSEKKDPVVQLLKLFHMISEGQYEKAYAYTFLHKLYFNAEASNLLKFYLDEADIKLKYLFTDFKKEIKKADSLKSTESVVHLDSIEKLHILPSVLLHTKFLKKKELGENEEALSNYWYEIRPEILKADPLFSKDYFPKSELQSYQSALRSEIDSLFKSSATLRSDLIRFGEICIQLENYELGAEVFYVISNYFSEQEWQGKNIPAYYFYCLEKMNVTKHTSANFDDANAELKKVEQAFQRDYQTFLKSHK